MSEKHLRSSVERQWFLTSSVNLHEILLESHTKEFTHAKLSSLPSIPQIDFLSQQSHSLPFVIGTYQKINLYIWEHTHISIFFTSHSTIVIVL